MDVSAPRIGARRCSASAPVASLGAACRTPPRSAQRAQMRRSGARGDAALGQVLLLADRAVDRLAEEVGVAGVASGFLDEVQQNPAE